MCLSLVSEAACLSSAPFANVAAPSFPGNLIWSQLQRGPASSQCLLCSPFQEKQLPGLGSRSGAVFQKGLRMNDKTNLQKAKGEGSLYLSTSGKVPVSLEFSLIDIPTQRHQSAWVRHCATLGSLGWKHRNSLAVALVCLDLKTSGI